MIRGRIGRPHNTEKNVEPKIFVRFRFRIAISWKDDLSHSCPYSYFTLNITFAFAFVIPKVINSEIILFRFASISVSMVFDRALPLVPFDLFQCLGGTSRLLACPKDHSRCPGTKPGRGKWTDMLEIKMIPNRPRPRDIPAAPCLLNLGSRFSHLRGRCIFINLQMCLCEAKYPPRRYRAISRRYYRNIARYGATVHLGGITPCKVLGRGWPLLSMVLLKQETQVRAMWHGSHEPSVVERVLL